MNWTAMEFFSRVRKSMPTALIFVCLLCRPWQHLFAARELTLYARETGTRKSNYVMPVQQTGTGKSNHVMPVQQTGTRKSNRAVSVQQDKISSIIDDELGRPVSAKSYNKIHYLSLRDIAKLCGGVIKWYGVSGKVLLSVNNNQISFLLGTKNIMINGKKRTLPAPIRVVRNDAFIPLDFFTSNAFMETAGYSVSYDPDKNVIFFDTIMNVFSPRHYSDNGRTRVNIELADKLQFKVTPKSKREYDIVFYNARALQEKYNFDEGNIKQITVRNRHRTVEYKIKLSRDDCIVEHKLKEKPLRLVFDVRTPVAARETITGTTTPELAARTPPRADTATAVTAATELATRPPPQADTATAVTAATELATRPTPHADTATPE